MAPVPSFATEYRRRVWLEALLVVLVVVVLALHDVLKDALVAAGWSRWWLTAAEGPVLIGLFRRSARNHRCPACGKAMGFIFGRTACKSCGVSLR
jgi:uncharacterized protein (DUF983 family)